MRKRIFTGWTWTRVAFVIIGLLIVVHAGLDRQWILTLPGLYFGGMGVFGLGCASGTCSNGSCEVKPDQDHRA